MEVVTVAQMVVEHRMEAMEDIAMVEMEEMEVMVVMVIVTVETVETEAMEDIAMGVITDSTGNLVVDIVMEVVTVASATAAMEETEDIVMEATAAMEEMEATVETDTVDRMEGSEAIVPVMEHQVVLNPTVVMPLLMLRPAWPMLFPEVASPVLITQFCLKCPKPIFRVKISKQGDITPTSMNQPTARCSISVMESRAWIHSCARMVLCSTSNFSSATGGTTLIAQHRNSSFSSTNRSAKAIRTVKEVESTRDMVLPVLMAMETAMETVMETE